VEVDEVGTLLEDMSKEGTRREAGTPEGKLAYVHGEAA
jgi:hypothetical protein